LADRIFLTGLTFFARHGVKEEERVLGQRFVIDLEAGGDFRAAARADDPALCVDYAAVYDLVAERVQGGPFRLIEALAEDLAGSVLARFPVDYVKVRVAKPHAPLAGVFREAAVEIERSKT
jgi:dihydroneopterin aldolase